MTCALQMFAYGAGADRCDEVTRMGALTALKCLKKFCAQVEYLYGGWYLRAPNAADLQRSEQTVQRGGPELSQAVSRKGYSTVILKAVASYDTHVWHAFFVTPGAQNDLNVLGASNVFARVINGSASEVTYKVNDSTYYVPYYLADGIYLRW
uniref:uncharacterized protein LOC105352669 n=1 Tax=Fragaria vesca subsp. vesca TaxID=101020 RepID=UPI0005CAF14F|nr:PREDICTED: uncharacterized protein LOC105352669 [Fragaria vesca subsp. vesca]